MDADDSGWRRCRKWCVSLGGDDLCCVCVVCCVCVCVVCVLCVCVFFFQAEDGIRDLVRSRGLGDVYKRQTQRRGGAEQET